MCGKTLEPVWTLPDASCEKRLDFFLNQGSTRRNSFSDLFSGRFPITSDTCSNTNAPLPSRPPTPALRLPILFQYPALIVTMLSSTFTRLDCKDWVIN